MKIINGSVFTNGTSFQEGTIHIADGRITAIESNISQCEKNQDGPEASYDASGCYVVPGFTDIHFHGCFGYDFSNYNLTELQIMGGYELQSGITQICPAAMTYPEERLASIIKCAKAYRTHPFTEAVNSRGDIANIQGADLVGVNLEGPFISMVKKGAQNPDFIIPPDAAMYHRLKALAPDLLKLITIAPETENALDLIEEIKDGITVSLGHTTADYETAWKAFQKGATHVTHLFNAMTAFSHRDAGIIGAAFDTPDNHVELICDGVHVSESMIRACFQLFTDNRVVLVSDSMMATGCPDGEYTLGSQSVTVNGNLATLHDGTIAGSVTNLADCFRYAVSIGIPLESALKAVTINPARSIGIDKDYGSIAPDKIANLLVLDRNLHIRAIIFHGEIL